MDFIDFIDLWKSPVKVLVFHRKWTKSLVKVLVFHRKWTRILVKVLVFHRKWTKSPVKVLVFSIEFHLQAARGGMVGAILIITLLYIYTLPHRPCHPLLLSCSLSEKHPHYGGLAQDLADTLFKWRRTCCKTPIHSSNDTGKVAKRWYTQQKWRRKWQNKRRVAFLKTGLAKTPSLQTTKNLN